MNLKEAKNLLAKEMEKIFSEIKDIENELQGMNFPISIKISEDAEILWEYWVARDSFRLIYTNKEMRRPLIETPFTTRLEVYPFLEKFKEMAISSILEKYNKLKVQ